MIMDEIFEQLSDAIKESIKISKNAYKEGIDETGNGLKMGETQIVVKDMSKYEAILGYNPASNESDLPERLGPIGARKAAAMEEFKTVENYFRIISYIEGQFKDI